MSFTSRIRGMPSTEVDDRDRCRVRHHALELIEVRAGVVRDQHADEIAVRADRDPAARVTSDDPLDLVEDPRLRVDEALTTREGESRGVALHRLPELRTTKRGQGPAGPIAGIHLDQRVGGSDLQAPRLRQRFHRLDAALERDWSRRR